MKALHHHLHRYFEKITAIFSVVLGSPITFIIAVVMIIFWLTNRDYKTQNINTTIGDIIVAV